MDAAAQNVRGSVQAVPFLSPHQLVETAQSARMSPHMAVPGCYMIPPGTIEPWSHKPNLIQRNEAERVRKREEAFQARRLASLHAQKEKELQQSLEQSRRVFEAMEKTGKKEPQDQPEPLPVASRSRSRRSRRSRSAPSAGHKESPKRIEMRTSEQGHGGSANSAEKAAKVSLLRQELERRRAKMAKETEKKLEPPKKRRSKQSLADEKRNGVKHAPVAPVGEHRAPTPVDIEQDPRRHSHGIADGAVKILPSKARALEYPSEVRRSPAKVAGARSSRSRPKRRTETFQEYYASRLSSRRHHDQSRRVGTPRSRSR